MNRGRYLTRRHVLWMSLSCLGCAGTTIAHSEGCSTSLTSSSDRSPTANSLNSELPERFPVSGRSPLRSRASARGLIYGAAASSKLVSDERYAAAFARECGILVPENALKWQALRPSPEVYDFADSDWFAEFARDHDMLFRGHTLVWDKALPDWFEEKVNRRNAEQFLVEHITTVVRHYAGQMHSWDVVNEAVAAERSDRHDGLHSSPWLQFLGKDYIDLAFQVAAEADPETMLVYNDRWLDYDISRDNPQRIAVLNLLEYLKAKGTPVHALGIQAHLNASRYEQFNPEQVRGFLRDVASLGLKILITELDVRDSYVQDTIEVRDRMVARMYEEYLSVVLDEPAVIAVLTWGLSDRYTWLSNFAPRDDGADLRPLPLDRNFNRKLAWNAIARALERAPRR